MDNFKKSANQLWKESNTTLTFKTWLERERKKVNLYLTKNLKGIDGVNTSEFR